MALSESAFENEVRFGVDPPRKRDYEFEEVSDGTPWRGCV